MNRLFLIFFATAFAAAGEFTVTVPFDQTSISLTEEGIYTAVTVEGLPYITTSGAPCLPIMPVRVAMPTGCIATHIEVVNADYRALRGGYDVMPANEPVPLSVEMDYRQAEPDEHIYSRSSYYPENRVALHSSSVYWGIPVAYLNVFPVRWNPADRTLQVLSEMTIRVEYEESPSVRLITRRTRSSEEKAMAILRRLVINPEGVSASGAHLVPEKALAYGQYVIITHPDYETQAQDLADWKTSKGVPACVYTTDWVNSQYSFADLQQNMRAFLTECRDEGTDYVLIFGDDDRVECRDALLVGSASYTEIAPSDLYFADINDTAPGADLWNRNFNSIYGEVPYPYQYPQPPGYDLVDYHPDLWVGRASVSSATEADIFLDKVFIYEGIQTVDYFETAPRELRVGYTTGILWSSPYIPGSASAESISVFIPSAEWEIEPCFESTGSNSSAITRDMIDAGPHHVYHASHGNITAMWTSAYSDYTTAHIMAQTNIQDGGLPALWQSISCFIGHLDGNECCADAWLASPGGGGFGCFNSRYGWGNFAGPCTGPSEMLCIRFYQDHWQNDIYNLGIAHGTSMDYYVPPCSTYMDWCLKEYNLFGDPELPIWTDSARIMSVSHPASINGFTTVSVTVTDGRAPLENARVCLQKGDWQTGEVYEVALTNATGEADIYVQPTSVGTLNITVWGRNFYTYLGSIDVSGLGTGESESPLLQDEFTGVYPNPATGSALISYSVGSSANVSIEVFDLSGRKIATLLNSEIQSGEHSLVWNLMDGNDRTVPAGIYHIRFSTSDFTVTESMMILR
ncbi:MAG: C25 family cysteine peptidase [Candidatus Fermentibacteria bacterium]